MARIIVATYMVRYPLGGMLSWSLQWIVGLQRLGHDVVILEKSNYPDSCFDPSNQKTSDDATNGLRIVLSLLRKFQLGERLGYLAYDGTYHGLREADVKTAFETADLLVDLGNHGAWNEEATAAGVSKVLVDGEPGYTQIKMESRMGSPDPAPEYDAYFTNGANIGTPTCPAPCAGREWIHVFNPVVPELFPTCLPPSNAPFTTVMNWQSHAPITFNGEIYGQKDIEFSRFLDLPTQVPQPMEVAVAGNAVPWGELSAHGWLTRNAQEETTSVDSYMNYLERSFGEFSVCKNIFVALNTGWFSDRSAAYLASGRPVILQDTGFSEHLPVGDGLFAFRSLADASRAAASITENYEHHSKKAREIAMDHLSYEVVLPRMLDQL